MTLFRLPDIPSDGKYHEDPSNSMNLIRIIDMWKPPGVKQVIGGGNTSCVAILDDGSILKYPYDESVMEAMRVEYEILKAITPHERVVRLLGPHSLGLRYGLRLEIAGNGNVRQYLQKMNDSVGLQTRQKWAIQCSEATAYIHSRGVIHCDIHPNNFLLDHNLDVKICDFAGSLSGELDGKGLESIRAFLPRDPMEEPTIMTDIFALGSTLFEIHTGSEPYPDLPDQEIEHVYRQHQFPDIQRIKGGRAIYKCWNQEYASANHLVADLRLAYSGEQ